MGVWIPLPQLWPHGGTENDAHTHPPQCSGFDSDEPTQRYYQFTEYREMTTTNYCIAGNFRMVLIFVYFVCAIPYTKIKIAKI